MENRIQYIFLRFSHALLACSSLSLLTMVNADEASIDNEYFELGTAVGILNVEDFGSEFTFGANAAFKATENFFLQFNYFQTEVAFSAYENSQSAFFAGDERTLAHYDLLLGYNLFQGEIFRGSWSGLSSLYAVAGVGDTDFGGETGFTYTIGLGYQMALTRRYTLRFDYRDYIYQSSLTDEIERTTHNAHLSFGLSYLF